MGWFANARKWVARQIAPSPAVVQHRHKGAGTFPFAVPPPKQKRYRRPSDLTADDDKPDPNEPLRKGLQGKGGFGWASDHREESDQYQGWVAVVVGALVKAAGESTVVVEQLVPPTGDDGGQEFDHKPVRWDHPLARLLRKPNPAYGWDGLIKRIVLQRSLTGSAFVWVVPAKETGQPCELYVIPTALVMYNPPTPSAPDGSYRVAASAMLSMFSAWAGFRGQAASGWFEVAARHMVRLSHLHPLTEMDGLSPVHANRKQIDVANETEELMWSVLQNGAFPSAIASLAAETGASADTVKAILEEMREYFESRYAGADKAGKVLPVYAMTLERWAMSLTEAVPPDLRAQNRDNVHGIFSTPSAVSGFADATSYSGLHAARQQFVDSAVQPELTDVGSMLTVQLAGRFGDDLVIKVEAKPVNDLEQKQKESESLEQSNLITVDEGRARRGLGPHPDKAVGQLCPAAVLPYQQSKFAPAGPPAQPGADGQPQSGGNPLPGGPAADGQPVDTQQVVPPDTSGQTPQFPGFPAPMQRERPKHDLSELGTYGRAKGLDDLTDPYSLAVLDPFPPAPPVVSVREKESPPPPVKPPLALPDVLDRMLRRQARLVTAAVSRPVHLTVRQEPAQVSLTAPAPVVHVAPAAVTLPPPVVNVAPAEVRVTVPEFAAPVVHVTVPDQPPPVVRVDSPVTVHLPEQPPPVVNLAPAEVRVLVPTAPAPVVNVAPPAVTVQPAAVNVRVTPEVKVTAELPPRVTATAIERGPDDLITRIVQTDLTPPAGDD